MMDYTYNRTWEDIHALLDEAERTKNQHKTATFNEHLSTKQSVQRINTRQRRSMNACRRSKEHST